jgi:hypothetical protein
MTPLQLFGWVPTFVDIACGPKGDGLKKQIEAGQYPGMVKTTDDQNRSTANFAAEGAPMTI